MRKSYVVTLVLLAVLTVLSLALNGVILFGLVRARQIALDAQQIALNTVGDTRAIVVGVSDDTFSYTLEVEQEIPIATSIPFNEEVTVPLRTTIPISTVVSIPINAGLLGTFDVDLPVHTLIPVDLELSVPISQTVNIATTVPLDVDVPIVIPLAETPLVDYMEKLDVGLGHLEESLIQLEERLIDPFSDTGK
jgi:hypothetical protein